MKIEFTKEWCLRMAQLEEESGAAFGAGFQPATNDLTKPAETEATPILNSNIAFGRFVQLMRRKNRLTIEKLAEAARVDVTELVEIEEDARHVPEPRTVYQLAHQFRISVSKLMEVAGLTQAKDNWLSNEAVRFAARSESVEELNEVERAALDAFVAVLSERK
jgi:HTH-type transcriptional regulator, competence development regulator